jgi:hypothetical protein
MKRTTRKPKPQHRVKPEHAPETLPEVQDPEVLDPEEAEPEVAPLVPEHDPEPPEEILFRILRVEATEGVMLAGVLHTGVKEWRVIQVRNPDLVPADWEPINADGILVLEQALRLLFITRMDPNAKVKAAWVE